MQVRLVISTLLLALQISAAALSEQPRTARLVKVKRAISLGADGAETERLQTSLKRRTIEAFTPQLRKLVEELNSASHPDHTSNTLTQMKTLVEEAQKATSGAARIPKPYRPPEIQPHEPVAPFVPFYQWKDALGRHEAILSQHESQLRGASEQLKSHEANLKLHEDNLIATQDIGEQMSANERANRRFQRNVKIALAVTAGLGTTAAVTSAMYSGMARDRFSKQSDDIDAVRAEIDRLKAANGQQLPPYGAGYPGQGIPATPGPSYAPLKQPVV